MTTTYAPTRLPARPRPKPRTKPRTKAKTKPRPRVPMEPRLRDRRIAVVREQGRRRLRRLRVVACVLGFATLGAGAALSPLLDVDHVAVRGVTGPRVAEIRAATGVSTGEPLLLVDTGAVEASLEELSWVAGARVVRHLPGTLTVSVVERVPVAWVITEAATAELVDERAVVLATAPAAPVGVPQLGATKRRDLVVAARVAGDLSVAFRPRVAAVVAVEGEVFLALADGIQVRLGAATALAAKVHAAEAVLASLGDAPAAYVDVRVPSAPVTG